MKFSIKGKNKYIEKIERAETLIKELRDIFAWDLNGDIELQMETATEKETVAEED